MDQGVKSRHYVLLIVLNAVYVLAFYLIMNAFSS